MVASERRKERRRRNEKLRALYHHVERERMKKTSKVGAVSKEILIVIMPAGI